MSNLWITPSELGEYANSEFSYQACKSASQLLWAMSGRKYSGINTVTERYICTTRRYRYGASTRNYTAELLNGNVYNIPYQDFNNYVDVTSDGLTPQSRLRLRGRPVIEIHAIRNRAGDVIDPNSYYLVDHSTIQAVQGVPWAPCDIEVTYTYGAQAPELGRQAAKYMAIQFIKLWAGEDCELPARVTSVSRQGVSYTVLDSQDFIQELRTGVYTVDLFLKSVNPDGARAKARVFNPDIPRARSYTAKQLKLAESVLDIAINKNTSGSATVTLESINAEFLTDDSGWLPFLTIRNYSEQKSKELSISSVVFLESDTKIKMSVTYEEALPILGKVDPGTYDLYATRPHPLNAGQTETAYICSGNLRVQLASSIVDAYTLEPGNPL
jgi:hypothetical protein